ncbi:MAG TPA: MarR family transcriptional regulator [Longimicrobiales bacterium]|nr:MarR family transcriptional regulator [Longimicrobiales bacterium]
MTDAGRSERRPLSLEQVTFLDLLRTSNRLGEGVVEVLRPAGLTPTQYNVLRILRGSGHPLTCGEIGERMITRDPDVTRLLDRLLKRGLVTRARSRKDRRVVVTDITAEGLRILQELDEPVARLHREQLGHLGPDRLRELGRLLEEAREGAG